LQDNCEKRYTEKGRRNNVLGLGVTGEAGNIASCIKKTFAHKKDVKDGIKENIGNMLWYIFQLGYSRNFRTKY